MDVSGVMYEEKIRDSCAGGLSCTDIPSITPSLTFTLSSNEYGRAKFKTFFYKNFIISELWSKAKSLLCRAKQKTFCFVAKGIKKG